jgi:hypothetical protein
MLATQACTMHALPFCGTSEEPISFYMISREAAMIQVKKAIVFI